MLGVLAVSALGLVGCGSSESIAGAERHTEKIMREEKAANGGTLPVEGTTSTPTPTATATDESSGGAAPSASSPPAFAVEGSTEGGDRVRVEGRLGQVIAPSQAGINQSVLEGCPQYDGRELVVQLDLTTTIESSLSGTVTVEGFNFAEPHLVDYVVDFAEGASCKMAGENEVSINLGTLQPHEANHLTMWAVLLDAVTARDPHPSAQTLAHQGWSFASPAVVVNTALVHFPTANHEISLIQ
jgi:hypothetical protein